MKIDAYNAFDAYSKSDARDFASKWLPAWTGNNPELLASFYSDDAFYSDPGIIQGIKGKRELFDYFKKLLGKNPNWIWTQVDSIPLQDGFLNEWKAEIPVGDKILNIFGVCSVQLREGLIYCNKVHFDRSILLEELMKLKTKTKTAPRGHDNHA